MNQEVERFEPAQLTGRIAYEHLHRYALCRDRVAGQRVLDVACGAGYGTNILAEVAAETVGVDIDAGAISRASKKYRRENLKFITADCCDMPFEASSFDVVVANEMIEHINDQESFLREVKRVLKPGGLLLVSTPNKPVYNRYKPPNPFHVAEMDVAEFRRLLRRHFKHVRLTGLRMALVSAAFEVGAANHPSNLAAAKTYRAASSSSDWPQVSNDELSFDDPEYLLASCSDDSLDEEPSFSTVFFSNEDDLWLEHEKIMAWASQLHEEDEILRADLRTARAELDDAKTALDEEQRTSDGRQHLTISSRLLARLTGAHVEADPIAIVEAMFSLNEQMITQRIRLEALGEAERRAADLERELESNRRAQENLKADVDRAGMRIDELMLERQQAQDEKERLAVELDNFREESDRNSAFLQNAVNEAQSTLAKLKRDLKQSELQRQELARKLDGTDDSDVPAGSSIDRERSALHRQRARLAASQAEIQKQLTAATNVRNELPAAVPASRSFIKRWTKSRSAQWRIVFDKEWIARQLPDAGIISLESLLRNDALHRVDPHPLFSASWYLDRYPDVAKAQISPLAHYLEHGWREGRNPHPFFANDWYLQRNPDVAQSGTNPLLHYLEHGWKEGRWPNPVFDPAAYLSRNPDVQAAGSEPLSHFIAYGTSEDRNVPFQGLERDWRMLVRDAKAESLMEYLLSGDVHAARSAVAVAHEGSWPPAPLNDSWIPQALRDFLMERRWESLIPLLTYLYSVMDAYSDCSDTFPNSDACAQIMERARTLSAQQIAGTQTAPAASIIIPVYNNVLDTLLCVLSLLESAPKSAFEIIVADDCSDDATAQLVSKIGGAVRHIRQPKNYGFVGNCNAAAKHARGHTLIFLNNDTLVLPGWLEGLLRPFEQLDHVGLVGSKLINWDGRLQEAGGILWKDGSAWNFGRGQNPVDPEFNYLKDVDYCSGASIAIPIQLWRELQGFDPSFTPAYCEDSDLAFRIRDAGLRTIYSPESELIHHEGRSHGRDTGAGVKAHQLTNQQHFLKRWSTVLERDHFPNGDKVFRARDRSGTKPHILVVDHYVPQVDKDAGSRTMFQFLQSLIDAGWAVTFWPENLHRDPEYTRTVQNIGVEVIYGPMYVGKFADFLRSRAGLYDAALLSRPHVAVHFIDDLRKLTTARVLYYGHDVHFERMKAQRQIAESIEEDAVDAMRTLEIELCNRCDVILYPAEEEARLMAKLVSKKVKSRAIPAYCFNEVEIGEAEKTISQRSMSTDKAAQLLFVGGFSHGPNVDGIVWFCREVAPLLREEGFQFQLQIVGSNPTADVWDLESDDTHVLGYVSEEKLLECYASASAVIAPLRFGAGVKGKVVEAMARGVPVATTRVGAQGLTGANDYLFLGDTPEQFAAAIKKSVESDTAVEKSRLALAYIRNHYSSAAMCGVLEQVLPPIGSISKAA